MPPVLSIACATYTPPNRKRQTPDANANANTNANMNRQVDMEVLGGDICAGAFLEGEGARRIEDEQRLGLKILDDEFEEVKEEDPSRAWQEERFDEKEKTQVETKATPPTALTSSALLSTSESGSFLNYRPLKIPWTSL